jgi:hypothetical protein
MGGRYLTSNEQVYIHHNSSPFSKISDEIKSFQNRIEAVKKNEQFYENSLKKENLEEGAKKQFMLLLKNAQKQLDHGNKFTANDLVNYEISTKKAKGISIDSDDSLD